MFIQDNTTTTDLYSNILNMAMVDNYIMNINVHVTVIDETYVLQRFLSIEFEERMYLLMSKIIC
jgi:hypothetical protein